ncbi:hypothetical protein, partial [Pseudophaeobacter arcticus]|uniref:hypothetical protein n=1 Tax=Pseudophaeobacter arcticus TaxID=385492 RepID=UPI0039E703EB
SLATFALPWLFISSALMAWWRRTEPGTRTDPPEPEQVTQLFALSGRKASRISEPRFSRLNHEQK